MITDYHAKLFAHELSKRHSADDSEKLAGTLFDAQVDLNPHQVEAALFAFKSPFSKGAILADEVGLGKTIEAGLLLAQKWTERKRRILIIMPANLRKQWAQELEEKFFLPTMILEAKNYNRMIKDGKRQPFIQDQLVLCSFQFAARRAEELMVISWDLVVIDEAHRLRNVYRPDNKIGKALKNALSSSPKVLLTATPLQNSLMELYGLVSIIDDYAFGDVKSFRTQYARITSDGQFQDLKDRLTPVCHRTLRRQVLEYIRYTNRIPITVEFVPSKDEQTLYELVSEYLRRANLQALPSAQRTLMTLIMRKLLASSTFAIAGTLDALARKLERQIKEDADLKLSFEEELAGDFEELDELAEEWPEDAIVPPLLAEEDIEIIKAEIDDLRAFRDLATSISENAKGLALLDALKAGFAKAGQLDAQQKAIIFTESRRTQTYISELLVENGYDGKIVLFSGTNNDDVSKQIYADWMKHHKGTDRITGSRSADMRAALVENFREKSSIMIATEAAAEGINLQFCSMVVNYDLPWNPQRIEQRIGRCHRYGQQYDVVVVNFLNKTNAADQRVFELLSEKFQLFSGVFGASDEVLGTIESGVEFEKRIVSIYQNCRTTDEIESEFKQLRTEMDAQINETMKDTRQKLLENFDAEVHDRLKINLSESKEFLNRYERLLWAVTKHELESKASFDDAYLSFHLKELPSGASAPTGHYHLSKKAIDGHRYRLGHSLAQFVLKQAADRELNGAEIVFDYSSWPQKASSIEPLVGKSGALTAHMLSITGADAQDHIIFAGQTDDGQAIKPKAARRLFDLPAQWQRDTQLEVTKALLSNVEKRQNEILEELKQRKSHWISEESRKLDKWAEDKIAEAEKQLIDVKNKTRDLKRDIRQSTDPTEQHTLQTQIQKLEKSKRRLRQRIFEVEDEIINERDQMITIVEEKLEQHTNTNVLFSLFWRVK